MWRLTVRHLDLCSGIGGFALGFAWAGLSDKPVAFCEIDQWCRKVLQHWWPTVPIFNDIKEVANEPDRVVPECDIITAGYPCQPFSVAKGAGRKGEADARHLWPHIREVVASRRPAWVVCENVYGHVRLGLDNVLDGLESLGYTSWAALVPACGLDAPHERQRLWLISCRETGMADTIGQRLQEVWPSQAGHEWGKPGSAETGGIEGEISDTDSVRCGGGSDKVEREGAQGVGEGGGVWPIAGRAGNSQGGCPESLRLNPAWVEWLMGYPVGWTSLPFQDSRKVTKEGPTKSEG